MDGKISVPILLIVLLVFVSLACSVSMSADQPQTQEVESPAEETLNTPTSFMLDCQEAQVVYALLLDFGGAMITTTTSLEIIGPDSGACVFHIKTEKVDVSYSEEALAQMKDNGISDEDIAAQSQMMADQAMEAGYDDT